MHFPDAIESVDRTGIRRKSCSSYIPGMAELTEMSMEVHEIMILQLELTVDICCRECVYLYTFCNRFSI